MILSGKKIAKNINQDIIIKPYNEKQLNPNSYNLRLHNELLVYDNSPLDMKLENKTSKLIIPQSGLLLEPGKLYLGRTLEYTKTKNFVPMLEGRSSIGRLGMFVHITAGFGDVGFAGYWTLEMFAVQPVKIYPGVPICQIFFHQITGAITEYSSDKYQHNRDIQPSMMFREMGGDTSDEQLELAFSVGRNVVQPPR